MPRIAKAELTDFAVKMLEAKGIPADRAAIVADYAVTAQAMGSHTHGLVQLGALDANIPDPIEPMAAPAFTEDNGNSALINGNGVIGQLVFHLATEVGMAKARSFGSGVIGVNSTHWVGAIGPYLIPVARAGMLAMVCAQNSTCQDSAPFGGIEPRLSTNPIGLAFPVGTGEDDIVVADFSTASMSMGRVNMLAKSGQLASDKVFIDKNGNDSNDPNDMINGGSIHLMGGRTDGHKGYALSLWCEAMTAMVGGNCNNPEAPQRQSFVLTVLNPEKFAGSDRYLSEMQRLVPHLHTSNTLPGIDAIRLPGEHGLKRLRESETTGVELKDALHTTLVELSDKHGIPFPETMD